MRRIRTVKVPDMTITTTETTPAAARPVPGSARANLITLLWSYERHLHPDLLADMLRYMRTLEAAKLKAASPKGEPLPPVPAPRPKPRARGRRGLSGGSQAP